MDLDTYQKWCLIIGAAQAFADFLLIMALVLIVARRKE